MSIRRSGRIAVAAVAVTALGVGTGLTLTSHADAPPDGASLAAASACHTSDIYEVCVAKPELYDDGFDTVVVDRLTEYVEAVPAGGTIHGAMYEWVADPGVPEIQGLVDALIDAHRDRDVDVQLNIGRKDRNDDVAADFTDAGIYVKRCDDGCLPHDYDDASGAMHLKIFTFADTDGGDVKVAHTSSNMTPNQINRHQNLITVNGDQALYDDYVGLWNRMDVQSWTYEDEEWTGRGRDADAPGLKMYLTPRPEGDPVPATLDKLSCDAEHNRVWVAASMFNGRPGVRSMLEQLHNDGCDVRVIVNNPDDHSWVTKADLDPDSVRILEGENGDGSLHWKPQHNKLLITDALYEGEPRTAVHGGSHNLNENNLRRSSDVMLRVVDQGVFDVFVDYYEDMFHLAG